MMLKLQMLPAGCGDCLWLEYGSPPATRVVIIDGGLRETGRTLQDRIDAARRQRGVDTLDVELMVVTHIDNDHILGIIELLKPAQRSFRVKDVWFNGRPQLMRLPDPPSANATLASPSDLLGPQQGDELSQRLSESGLPWNQHPNWNGAAVRIPDAGNLPRVTLDGGLQLTLLGPTSARLYKLCTVWTDVLGGTDETTASEADGPADLLGRRDTWPPEWKDGETRDASAANGSSIMLLAEYDGHALLLTGDGYAADLFAALERLSRERNTPSAPLELAAFKLSHHGSEKNLTRAVLEKVDCCRYLISTDGSTHAHPDNQALLRILRYSRRTPQLLFNHDCERTRPWRDSKSDVLEADFQDYEAGFPTNAADGLILELT